MSGPRFWGQIVQIPRRVQIARGISGHLNASREQQAYRWRNDDGGETAATWIFAENTAGTISLRQRIRLRVQFAEVNATVIQTAYKLQWSIQGSGAWQDLGVADASGNEVVIADSLSGLVDQSQTTDQLTSVTTPSNFTAGYNVAHRGLTSAGATSSISLGGTQTECEWCIMAAGPMADGTVLEFRVVESGGTLLEVYNVTPQFTISNNTTDLRLQAYRLRNDDGSESTATWKAVQDTGATIASGEIFRLRTRTAAIWTTAGPTDTRLVDKLEYRLNAGAWTLVPEAGTDAPVTLTAASTNVAENDPTTEQLTGGTRVWDPGVVNETGDADKTTNVIEHPYDDPFYSEHEHVVIMPTGGVNSVADADVLEFRVTNISGVPRTSDVTPTVTASVAGAGITGTLSKSFGPLTVSSAGDVRVAGTATPSFGALAVTSAGAVKVDGSATPSFGALASTASGAVKVVGSATPSFGALTVDSTGTVGDPAITGTLSRSFGALTLSSATDVAVAGTAGLSLGSLALSAVGDVRVVGTLSKSFGPLVVEATATTTGVITGTLNKALGPMSVSAGGSVLVEGSLNAQFGGLNTAAEGGIIVGADGTLVLPALIVTAAESEPEPAASARSVRHRLLIP